jgi:DNA-binding NtrC family response regulator
MTDSPISDAILDRSPVIPVDEIGELTDLRAWREELHAMVARWNIRRAKIVAYQKGVPLGAAEKAVKDHESRSGYEGDLADINAQAIEDALLRNGHNRTRAARELGITRRTLLRMIEKYKIESPSTWGPGRT